MTYRPAVRPACAVLVALVTTFASTAPLWAQEACRFEAGVPDSGTWLKGNTHTHTLESDGDSPPETVVRWYRDHDYNFLVLSDHNVFTDPAGLTQLTDSSFILIGGEELTSSFEGAPVHVNGLNIPHVLEAQRGRTLLETVQLNVDEVRSVDGVPHINHPNFGWALSAEVLLEVREHPLLEIYNGHPQVHNVGAIDAPDMEEVWDILLTADQRIYGIAVDDAHHFQGEFARHRANPGRGWVAVKAPELAPAPVMAALEAGHFYASTGVTLEDVVSTPGRLEVRIQPQGNFRYTTEFVGPEGRILATRGGTSAALDLPADARGYVRARVTDSGGAMAWVQPVFIGCGG
ncbi:MAG: CehA/McbA family metallohydrolase [Gemmatimonadota bacterium]